MVFASAAVRLDVADRAGNARKQRRERHQKDMCNCLADDCIARKADARNI